MTAFRTDRLQVRPWEETLADQAAREALETRLAEILTPAVLQHLPPYFAPGHDPGAISRWIDIRAERANVSLVETGGRLIGLLFLFRPDADGPRHLGYLLEEAAWGQGHASELLHGVIAELRRSGPLELLAGVAADNPASARVLLKSGFLEEEPDTENSIRRFRLALP